MSKSRPIVDVKRVARPVCSTWWRNRDIGQMGVPLQTLDDEDVWTADGFTAWHLDGDDAKWLSLTLAADAVDHVSPGQAKSDIAAIHAAAIAGATFISPTNLLLRVEEKLLARMFVGPGDEVLWINEAFLAPLGDVMLMQWRTIISGRNPVVGGTLTDDLCLVTPLHVPGQHTALARAWRAWNGADLMGGDGGARMQPVIDPDLADPADVQPLPNAVATVVEAVEHG